MLYTYHKIKRRLKSQDGFVLVVAVIAVMIMIAVGFLALTVSTQDIRISSRMVGETKAFSAAEAGVTEASRRLNPIDLQPIPWTVYDPDNNPGVGFEAGTPDRYLDFPSIDFPGYSLRHDWAGAVFSTTVTGEDRNYKSRARISVGIAYSPSPSDTQY
ncbi:MAG TPA: hypothetical protein ENN23_05190 [Deltaproteobacteria bacterium]|nr:hypothetical protein [Deltaproteobacteria bacterium]